MCFGFCFAFSSDVWARNEETKSNRHMSSIPDMDLSIHSHRDVVRKDHTNWNATGRFSEGCYMVAQFLYFEALQDRNSGPSDPNKLKKGLSSPKRTNNTKKSHVQLISHVFFYSVFFFAMCCNPLEIQTAVSASSAAGFANFPVSPELRAALEEMVSWRAECGGCRGARKNVPQIRGIITDNL